MSYVKIEGLKWEQTGVITGYKKNWKMEARKNPVKNKKYPKLEHYFIEFIEAGEIRIHKINNSEYYEFYDKKACETELNKLRSENKDVEYRMTTHIHIYVSTEFLSYNQLQP